MFILKITDLEFSGKNNFFVNSSLCILLISGNIKNIRLNESNLRL